MVKGESYKFSGLGKLSSSVVFGYTKQISDVQEYFQCCRNWNSYKFECQDIQWILVTAESVAVSVSLVRTFAFLSRRPTKTV